jgi:hypothetical protein
MAGVDTILTRPTRTLRRHPDEGIIGRMVSRPCVVLSYFFALCSCNSGGLWQRSLGPDGADAAQETAVGEIPPDARCGLTPRMLASAGTFPRPASDAGNLEVIALDLVANASDLYYVISVLENNGPLFSPYLPGSVMRVPLSGGQPIMVASGALLRRPLLTATSVILAEMMSSGEAIVSLPVDGSTPTTLATYDPPSLAGPVTDGNYVYFSDLDGIEAVPLATGSAGATVVTLSSDAPNELAVFGQRLIYLLPQGAVDSIPLPPAANSPVTTLGTGASGPADLMPCGTDACWLGEGADAIMRIAPTGGAISVILLPADLARPLSVAFDGADFYIVGGEFGTTERLGRMATDGSSSVILATMPAGGGGSVAVDDQCVYWSNALGIFSLAKTAEGPFAQ